jgi:hypothetical protein
MKLLILAGLKPTRIKAAFCLSVVCAGAVASIAGWPALFFVQMAATPLLPVLNQKILRFPDKSFYLNPLGGLAATLIYGVFIYLVWSVVQGLRHRTTQTTR